MRADRTGPPRGRQREADRNDERVLRAAREVFAELGWDAPVSEIARRAGVGMGSLYRRYPAKEDLAQALRVEGMNELTLLARTALADHPDPWAAFAAFLRAALSTTDTGSLLALLGGRLPATDEVDAADNRLQRALDDLVDAAHRSGALRRDFTSADIPLLLTHLNARLPTSTERAIELHLRYLDLVLRGLQNPPKPGDQPTSPPDWTELRGLWNSP
ncbi:TetR/AcrR family transcriptional regulator [Streptomyces sp. NEAU-sy36]|uniref:TetR/AcrR family transcriptional regulator n=1 Tax=unclassified Streptomyces TaxID=2593676 RepID=UPI0015D5ED04|nr:MULTISPECIES: TetR/AcrR family transcriptional regulator [unclassified Streptomyces]QLJ02924.1 TetR/AcrR family transcriptional regulator [Streptomyces sp. NEAU-sy36]